MDKLSFYSKSKDALPGEGTNEYIKDHNQYHNLSKIKDWRRILSNFHVYPFKYTDGYTYNSIEHVFQAKKIALVDPEKAYLFTLESKSEIGTGAGDVARKHRKLVILSPLMLKKWDSMKNKVMFDASACKYGSCEVAKDVLLETNNAELWHIVMRSKPVRFKHLEEVRELLLLL